MGNQYWSRNPLLASLIGGGFTSQSVSATPVLDSDYASGGDGGANNADGDGIGMRFTAPPGGVHVDEIYFFLHTAGAGSENLIAGITDSNSAAYGTRAARTYLNSGNCYALAASGTTSTKWIKFVLTDTTALTPGKTYWAVCGRADNGSQTHTLRGSGDASTNGGAFQLLRCCTTTDGWNTTGSGLVYGIGCIKFSDGTWYGQPYTDGAADDANNTLERGLLITGLTEKLTINGLIATGLSTNIASVVVYEGTTASGGTVWSGFNGGSAFSTESGSETIGALQLPPFTMSKDTVYRIVFRYAGNTTLPGYDTIEDWATLSDAAACAYMQGRMCYTIDNGSGGWTDYNTAGNGYRLPRFSLVIEDQVAITAGASGGLLINPGLSGGLV